MKNTANETVTYIKDGNLKTIILNSRNRKKVLREIFVTSYYGSYNQLTATIKDDIDYVHFENVNFIDYRKFICWNPYKKDNNTICIFENCTLELNNISPIYFKNGIFRLINTKLDNIEELITIEGKELYLQNIISPKYGLRLDSENIYLTNSFFLSRLHLDAKRIAIDNSNIFLKEGDSYPEIIILTDNINLHKSNITCNFGGYVTQTINFKEITIDELSSIKSNQPIYINNNKYIIEPAQDFITIKKDNIKEIIAGSIIKTYNNFINEKIERKKQQILKTKFKELKEEIKINEDNLILLKEEYELKIKTQEEIINNLKQKLENKNKEIGTKISKSLKKKPLKYFESK